MPRANCSSRAAWGSIPAPQLDKAIGQGQLWVVMCCFWQSVPLLRALPASRRQLVFAEGWSAATEQGPGPGLVREPCSSFLGRGQVMSTARAGWQAPHCRPCSACTCCTRHQGEQMLLTQATQARLGPICSISLALLCELWPLMSSVCCLSALQPPGTGSACVCP